VVDEAAALRATSDELLRDLEALGALEEEKRAMPVGDPRLTDLAARIEIIATRVLASSARQRGLTEVVSEAAAVGVSDPGTTIEATPRSPSDVLQAWREAERRAAAAEPGSPEALEANVLIERLREEYRVAFTAREREQDRD
jgi:hypothetical protein